MRHEETVRRYDSGEEIYYHDDGVLLQFVLATVQRDDGGDFVHIGTRDIPREWIYPDGARDEHLAMLKEYDRKALLAGGGVVVEDMLESHKALAIQVWRFNEAPQVLQDMSDNGGDEDWVALVPKEMADGYIGWLDSPAFGCCCIDEHKWGDYRVYIGCHA